MLEKNSVKKVIGLIGAKILLDFVFLTWDVPTYLVTCRHILLGELFIDYSDILLSVLPVIFWNNGNEFFRTVKSSV